MPNNNDVDWGKIRRNFGRPPFGSFAIEEFLKVMHWEVARLGRFNFAWTDFEIFRRRRYRHWFRSWIIIRSIRSRIHEYRVSSSSCARPVKQRTTLRGLRSSSWTHCRDQRWTNWWRVFYWARRMHLRFGDWFVELQPRSRKGMEYYPVHVYTSLLCWIYMSKFCVHNSK